MGAGQTGPSAMALAEWERWDVRRETWRGRQWPNVRRRAARHGDCRIPPSFLLPHGALPPLYAFVPPFSLCLHPFPHVSPFCRTWFGLSSIGSTISLPCLVLVPIPLFCVGIRLSPHVLCSHFFSPLLRLACLPLPLPPSRFRFFCCMGFRLPFHVPPARLPSPAPPAFIPPRARRPVPAPRRPRRGFSLLSLSEGRLFPRPSVPRPETLRISGRDTEGLGSKPPEARGQPP